jgi:hypothetical protein
MLFTKQRLAILMTKIFRVPPPVIYTIPQEKDANIFPVNILHIVINYSFLYFWEKIKASTKCHQCNPFLVNFLTSFTVLLSCQATVLFHVLLNATVE